MSMSWPWHTQSLLGDVVRGPDSRRPLSGGCCSEEGQGAGERDGKGLLCLVMHSVVKWARAQRYQRTVEQGSLWPGLIHSWQMSGMRSKQALKAKNLLIWMMFKTMDVDIFEFGIE